jgi:Trypsin-like peptidase domain
MTRILHQPISLCSKPPRLRTAGFAFLLGALSGGAIADDFDALQDMQDTRVVIDRFHPENNAHAENLFELNAIGVLAPLAQDAQTVYGFGSGALIDTCHVLTAQHVIYGWHADFDVPPPSGNLEFLVGQTTPEEHNLTEGLRYVRFGTATVLGGTGQHGGRSDRPERDWALVTLTEDLPGIAPLQLHAFDPALRSGPNWILAHGGRVGLAGFPGDHMAQNPLIAHAHLWGSFGQIVGVYNDPSAGFAYFTVTAPATPGASGGMAFTTIEGRHEAVGIIQSRSGDGIHDLDRSPTAVVLITPHLLQEIHTAQTAHPCATGVAGQAP